MRTRPRLTVLSFAAAATLLLGATACTDLDTANAAGIGRDDMVSELAIQLARVTGLTYTAKYQLTGGETATVTQAQKPTRTAYLHPGGRLLETVTGTVRCDRALNCTETDPAPPAAGPLTGSNLITPESVLAMLNAAALDQVVEAGQHDTTIAGRHATCLDLTGVDRAAASAFGVCVTNEGALASFTGTIAGERFDQALTAYEDTADLAALELPAAAKLTDKRSK
ncbi:hypothetical protein ACFQS1_07235 [Paractinoplanes rhizophilus]|uniref:Lipoprotein n=1 Tax=Paractinoplanes rhizophilus TaxID=1416877 RepID=A0ABW2HME0_9ACTN